MYTEEDLRKAQIERIMRYDRLSLSFTACHSRNLAEEILRRAKFRSGAARNTAAERTQIVVMVAIVGVIVIVLIVLLFFFLLYSVGTKVKW
jgi:hypothetical protein